MVRKVISVLLYIAASLFSVLSMPFTYMCIMEEVPFVIVGPTLVFLWSVVAVTAVGGWYFSEPLENPQDEHE